MGSVQFENISILQTLVKLQCVAVASNSSGWPEVAASQAALLQDSVGELTLIIVMR